MGPPNEVGPRRTRPGTITKNNQATDDFCSPSIGQTADHFVKRLLQDVLAEETVAYWLRRAEAFERIGTPACREIAQACRNRATLARFEDEREAVTALLQEVS